MADKQEINKERADSKRYYNLLMSKVGQIKKGDNILLVHIGNLDVIRKIVDNYPEGNYIIVDKKCYGPVLSLLYSAFKEEKKFIATTEDSSIIEALQSLTMKFDKIIMNPPYGKNLHLKILEEALKHLSQDGACVNLSPIRWLQDPLARYKKNCDLKKFEESVAKHIESLDCISKKESSNMFGIAVNTDLAIYHFTQNGGYDCDKCRLYRGFDPALYWQKISSRVTVSIEDKKEDFSARTTDNFTFVSQIDGHPHRMQSADRCVKTNYHWFIDGCYEGKTPQQIKDSISASSNGTLEKWPTVFFNTGEEAKNFYRACDTKFFRFLVYAFTIDQNVPLKFLPWMGDCINPRTGLKGYLSEWTDEDFYKYFGITEEEQKLIESTMEKNTNNLSD